METLRAILEHKGRAIRTTSPSDQVLAAVDDMCRHHVGALLVVEGDEPVGIVSERDLLRRVLLERRDPATTRVEEIMTREVVCVDLDVTSGEAMRVMTEQRCRHLPVVVDGKIVGVISIGDLVRAASHDQEYEIQMLNDYVNGRYPG
jgi:CBS domain-containing protein